MALTSWLPCYDVFALTKQSVLAGPEAGRPPEAMIDWLLHAHFTSLILITAECPILCTATTLSPRWQYFSCFATDMAACTSHDTLRPDLPLI